MHGHSMYRTETAEQILNRLSCRLDKEGRRNIINVTRDDVMDGARRGFTRATFVDERVLSVRFSGEGGIDDGGPTREFMRLALKGLRDSRIFEGPENCKTLSVDVSGKNKYQRLMIMIVPLHYCNARCCSVPRRHRCIC